MALDFHIDVAVVGLQLFGEVHQTLLGFRRQLGAVHRELHGIIRQHHGIEELALRQLAGRLGPLERFTRGLVQLAQLGLLAIDLRLGRRFLGVHHGNMLVDVVFSRAAPQAQGAHSDGRHGKGGGFERLHKCLS